jgi:hypothetical protein
MGRTMRRGPGILLAALYVTGLATVGMSGCAEPGDGEGDGNSSGVAPVSETWADMVQRDAEWQADPAGQPEPWQGTPSVRNRPGVRHWPPPTDPGGAVQAAFVAQPAPFELGILAPQTIGTSFMAIDLQDQLNASRGAIPPDTMGAIGPDHFVEMINASVAVYDRTGRFLSHVSLSSFFTFSFNGTTYPRNGTSDPRILFDHHSSRWFACALELGSPRETANNIVFGVCRTSNPLTGTWDKYLIPVGVATSGGVAFLTDFDTLGLDDNGVYFGMRIFASDGTDRAKIAATPKSTLIADPPSLGAVFQADGITDMGASPQPAHNHDPVGPLAPAWFVASSATEPANVTYRTLSWSGGVPTLSGTGTVTTPSYAGPFNAPASGSSVNISVGDDRLGAAVIRNNRLWTSRNVGVNSAGGNVNADRTACEWLELDVSSPTAVLIQSGRVYDPAASDPRYCFYPSIMVNGQGDAAMGFSGSKATEFVGAYTCGRTAADPPGAMQAVALIKSGEAPYQRLDNNGENRWGDYSATSLDPNDDTTIWTIQEYATNINVNIWGTWTAQLLSPTPPPLTATNEPIAACQGGSATITMTGTGFVSGLTIQISGTGVTVDSAVVNGSASIVVAISVDYGAALGARSIVVTNPNGQAVTATGGLEITPGSHFDFDHDCDVDLTDFAYFQACINGPNNAPAPNCTVNADMNGDGDVDLADFAGFEACFNGPNEPVPASCPW